MNNKRLETDYNLSIAYLASKCLKLNQADREQLLNRLKEDSPDVYHDVVRMLLKVRNIYKHEIKRNYCSLELEKTDNNV